MPEVAECPNRPLDAVYTLVFFDAIRIEIRDEGFVRMKGDRIPPLAIHKLLSEAGQECRKADETVGRAACRYGRVVQLTTCANWHATCSGHGGRPRLRHGARCDYSVSQLKRL
ncbi:hypothetical protein BQ8482_850005 [Mesorhizobium delmotii]|uniref:Transposase n=1 Tax=Mesorhizobium delmotii TaxID=1631247 RepID=A0A2P9AWN7_9HYPH|nr:hypothetical protein BQ8482_850005 [Mesorhizobium delmotii]